MLSFFITGPAVQTVCPNQNPSLPLPTLLAAANPNCSHHDFATNHRVTVAAALKTMARILTQTNQNTMPIHRNKTPIPNSMRINLISPIKRIHRNPQNQNRR
ncbi:hypothetical protein V8G54_029233 [Vigna mungo]|uniref:Uncharacterized protein n=1 Tax=Vigna mungo TaxID=3915 RepID=A0AAQ3MTI3_VIGMU